MRGRIISRDVYGGAIFVVIGLVILVQGRSFGIGTLAQVGSGLFPVVLGVVLIGLGALIALGGIFSSDIESESVPPMQWKGFAAIVSGVIAFIAIGGLFGLAPAAFSCVFISALGDRTATIKSAAILATVMTLFALCFFSYFLNVQFPVFQLPTSWGSP
jgi:Tripartite tricarboxylate transporter TctB family